ncbi:hypothetical protein GCM10023168_00930 [Fodinibacter luteus]|uniref:Uncharacterized protein n=1 Tax=Fodinibacter luteus TaxID=552064 RepID=A0ABP8JVS5_9MICO
MRPAPPSREGGADAGRPASVDVVPPAARTELDRVRQRWAQLPLAQAEQRMPLLRRVVDELTARWADEAGSAVQADAGQGRVRDLGPAVAVDQLTVVVWDAYATGRGHGIPQLLTELRRDLA